MLLFCFRVWVLASDLGNVGGGWCDVGMTALMDATVEQVGALAAVAEMLVEVDRTIGSLLAARDGLLALGSRIAVEAAEQADEPSADGVDLAVRAVAAEFGAALRVSDRTV